MSIQRVPIHGDLAPLREELLTWPCPGRLGVQRGGGESSAKMELNNVDTPRVVVDVMDAILGDHEAVERVQWWVNRTPGGIPILPHDHAGDWSAVLYASLPQDPAPLVFETEEPQFAEVEEGEWIVWPAHYRHRVDARPGEGLRIALVCNVWDLA